MESIDYDRLMQADAARVFSERDPTRILDAIRELYAAETVLIEPAGVCEGQAAIRKLRALLPRMDTSRKIMNENSRRASPRRKL